MRKRKFSEAQSIGLLREQEVGNATAGVCRRHGISGTTYYKWKAKQGDLDISDAERRRALEGENAKLKKLLAVARLHADASEAAMMRVTAPTVPSNMLLSSPVCLSRVW